MSTAEPVFERHFMLSLSWTSQKECQVPSGWELEAVNKCSWVPCVQALDKGNGEIISYCPSPGVLGLGPDLFSKFYFIQCPTFYLLFCLVLVSGHAGVLIKRLSTWNNRYGSGKWLWLCSIFSICLSWYTLHPSSLCPVSQEAHPVDTSTMFWVFKICLFVCCLCFVAWGIVQAFGLESRGTWGCCL